MNEYQRVLMDKPSHLTIWCVACGAPANNKHHVVPRSQGGKDGPRLMLCGSGTTGCHGAAHDRRLHFDWRDGWHYLRTPQATKLDHAMILPGWKPIGARD